MSRDVYGNLGQSQRSPKPSRRSDVPSHSQSSKYYNSSISQPVSSHGSPIVSRTTSSDARRRGTGYGVSRSSNVSPTAAADPVPHSISTSAFNVGHSNYYADDPGSPMMDGRSGPTSGTGHHRSRSVTRVPLRNYHSLERDQEREFMPIREPRDRSLDRTEIGTRHPRSRERSLDRSGYRERDDHVGYRDMDGPIESDPYRDGGHMTRAAHSSYGESRHGYGRSGGGGGDGYVMEIQSRMNDLQTQYSGIKRELEATTQKLGSSMHSIKTFWSPELKKERALRKEEAAKYALINDQLKMLRAENQKQSALIRQLEEELRLSHMRNPDAEVTQHLEALYNEKEHMTKEIYLLRETIKELEMRIDTQKQTLSSRDESIKKLMEIKGVEERIEFERMKNKVIESEARSRHFESMLDGRDKDLNKREKNKVDILEAILETKESRISILEKEIELLEGKFVENTGVHANDKLAVKDTCTSLAIEHPSPDFISKTFAKEMEELRIELNRRDQEIMAMGAKMKTLEEQHHDYQRHIAVLKESLCAKEEHYNMLQADVEELRVRLEEKNKLIEKKTQQAMSSTQERNRYTQEVQELRDHMEIKDRKINVLQRKIENLEDLLKEKDNQVDMARARLTAIQAHHSSSEGALSSLEEAIGDKDKQISQLREQRDRAEMEKNEERELHERDIAEYKMKMHSMESEMEKLQAAGPRSDGTQQQKQVQDLKVQLKQVEEDKDKALTESQKLKEDAIRLQAELERLLDIMTSAEKEKFALNEQIKELQEAVKEKDAKMQGAKRGQQADRTKNAQMMEEARRRESEASKEASKAQEQVLQQLDRIEELEEALRESVCITAQREVAVAQLEEIVNAAEEKIDYLQTEVVQLQNANSDRCTNCAPIRKQIAELEERLMKLLSERRLHLEELFEMKQEALSAAISEKDSHVAILEVSGIKDAKTAEEVDKLKAERKQLVERIKNENEKRMKLLIELGETPDKKKNNGNYKRIKDEEEEELRTFS